MTKSICFIGNPRKDCKGMLSILRRAGITPRRIQGDPSAIESLKESPPLVVMVCNGVEGRKEIISTIHEQAELAEVPVIVRVSDVHPDIVERAFLDGADDFLVDGCFSQLEALVASIQQADTWHAVRAPNGLVVLAEEDRLERVKLSRVLRRNGFDTHFASSVDELERSLSQLNPRAVVASAGLSNGSLVDAFAANAFEKSMSTPWIVIGGSSEALRSSR